MEEYINKVIFSTREINKNRTPIISIIGASSFIGKSLYGYLSLKLENFSIDGTSFSDDSNKNFSFLDVTDKKTLEDYLVKTNPDFVIWLSGWKPLECKKDYSSAMNLHITPLINALGVIDRINPDAKIIYISSDYVFDGKVGGYTERDNPTPVTNYGKLKTASEQLLLTLGNKIKIVRSSAIMGKGGIFFEWMLNELKRKNEIKAFSDIYFSPTPLQFFNEIIGKIILDYNHLDQSIIHISGGKRLSRYEFIKFIANLSGFISEKVIPETRDSIKNSNSKEFLFGRDLSLVPSRFVKLNMTMSFGDYMKQEIKKWKKI